MFRAAKINTNTPKQSKSLGSLRKFKILIYMAKGYWFLEMVSKKSIIQAVLTPSTVLAGSL